MLASVKVVQGQESRKGVSCVKHQRMVASDFGDADKTFFAGDKSLEAGGTNNTSYQFEVSEKSKKVKTIVGKVA